MILLVLSIASSGLSGLGSGWSMVVLRSCVDGLVRIKVGELLLWVVGDYGAHKLRWP
jgi:hypothetical protein